MHFCSSSQPSISSAQHVGWQLLEVYRKQEGALLLSVAPAEARSGNGDALGFMEKLLPSFPYTEAVMFVHSGAGRAVICWGYRYGMVLFGEKLVL